MSRDPNAIYSRFWDEEAELDNPFAARACYCAGYDVYGELLGRASWSEYLFLLIKGERPTPGQRLLMEGVAVMLANPGPRDPSVQAAMSAGAGGSGSAASLMAALAVGAGGAGGARELYHSMLGWERCGSDLGRWRQLLRMGGGEQRADVWPALEHPPGFDPHGAVCPTPVRQALTYLASVSEGGALPWLRDNRETLEAITRLPSNLCGVASAAFVDLGLVPEQGEMAYLLLRLPGAAVHALEQRELGWDRFPFFADALVLGKGDSVGGGGDGA